MITDLTKANNNWIYQSNKLIEASYSFTVLEQKLIRLLASMITKDDVDLKEYQFSATDLSNTLNIHKRNIYRELDSVTDKLMARFIKMKNDDTQEFDKFHLIKTAKLRKGILTLKIDEDMKDFYLKLNWYTKYQLKNIMQFKSTYSFRLYELLKQYEGIGNRSITIDNLRVGLDIEKKQYPKYSNLKQKVINVALNEINTKTDIIFDYEEIKTGRKVTSIKFNIKANKANNIAIEEICATKASKSTYEANKYSVEDIKTVKSIFKEDITVEQAKSVLIAAKGNLKVIKEKYDLPRKIDVGNIVGWVIDAIKEKYKAPKGMSNAGGSFNDYEQRKYDFDKLESSLLGKYDDRFYEESTMSVKSMVDDVRKAMNEETSTTFQKESLPLL
ncbi:replication initiation protein [Clostridium estertheticum]|uniref:replication initiation protein n=1 Tax=Clostridium estertheticum TaxID=238834 RepID=UPI001CF514D2|nr:replication initiation protein [Clostridium estertheticum]MCB2307400.1 replication initiation protein [Clostridium estertheticum]MCB2345050.1 replication initiation protein [Clostridium estertheticum]MCB2349790.1 replication initiation protein [Clostridium estertheticum]WAG48086.1 replication initiation protein [Clostridium estertheticum]